MGFQARISVCKGRDGNLVGYTVKILGTWSHYFESLLNDRGNERECRTSQMWEDLTEINLDKAEPSSYEYFIVAIATLKNNKSPGQNGIDVEMLNCSGEDVTEELYNLILEVWSSE